MGIQGLLPLLKSIHKSTHLRNFAGQTLGVDAYGWLHRGVVACAVELALQKPTRKHIDYVLHRVRMLIHFGAKPYLVFDGDYLPSKAHTERERAGRRKEAKRLGLELLRLKKESQAHLELQKAVDVTPLMARELIEELRRMGVPYVVAPYEADSQLAYMEKQGLISGIVSEDSDLLVFGAKCLLTKLDQYGECVMIKRADFTACREISLVGWTDTEFRMMAMLSGCDYLPGIDKMGLKTAYRLVRKYKNLDRILRVVQLEGKMKVPAGFSEAFLKADRTFLYQWVYCTEARCLVNFNKVPASLDLDSMPYIGKPVDPETATGVALGDLEPNTKQPLYVPSLRAYPANRMGSIQTPDEKQGKPISEYFKARRTPLAELDPNAFTPSPSQQQLLATQTSSWSASQAPPLRVPALDRVAERSLPSSAPQAGRRTVSEPWPARLQTSPKRQRLCSDSTMAQSIRGDRELDSRFFKPAAQASPSLRKLSGRKDDNEFDLWSDDSAADAFAALTGAPEQPIEPAAPLPKKRKKLEVYHDATHAEAGNPADNKAVPADTDPDTARDATKSRSNPRQGTALFAPRTISRETVFSQGVNASFASLKSRFTFRTDTPSQDVSRTRAIRHGARTVLPANSRNEVFGQRENRWVESKHVTPVANEEEPSASDSGVVFHSSPPQLQQRNHELDTDDHCSVPQRSANTPPSAKTKGSEDFLVPESPASSEEDDGRLKPKLNLAQYAFAG